MARRHTEEMYFKVLPSQIPNSKNGDIGTKDLVTNNISSIGYVRRTYLFSDSLCDLCVLSFDNGNMDLCLINSTPKLVFFLKRFLGSLFPEGSVSLILPPYFLVPSRPPFGRRSHRHNIPHTPSSPEPSPRLSIRPRCNTSRNRGTYFPT